MDVPYLGSRVRFIPTPSYPYAVRCPLQRGEADTVTETDAARGEFRAAGCKAAHPGPHIWSRALFRAETSGVAS